MRDVRSSGMAHPRGATGAWHLLVYFSFFIVVSALLLAALFFKLGIEHRASEVGLLRAVGFGLAPCGACSREGILLALAGSALGIPAAAYAALLMTALGSWWVDAVGTEALTLHVSMFSLLAGAVGGIASAVACIWWTLRSLGAISERSLLAGRIETAEDTRLNTRRTRRGFMSHLFEDARSTHRTAVASR